MNTLSRNELSPGVIFSSVKDSRFKNMKISANIFLPLSEETAAENALLCYMLVRNCKAYPDFTAFSRKFASLYGAEISGSISKMGDMQCIDISVSGIDDRYAIYGESISEELSRLLCEVLFNPKVENGSFCQEDMEQEKRQLFDMIDSEFNDKRLYASQRLLEIMCDSEVFGIKRYGSREQIEALTTRDVYRAWERMLKTAHFEFIYVGDSDSTKASQVIKNSFKEITRQPVDISTDVVYTVFDQKNVTDEMEVSQSKLEIGFRTACAEPEPDVDATRLMCTILGGTAHSKLFNNVREKQSLCYYCGSRYLRLKGIMLIESGVETENIEKAKQAILNEVEEMKKGNITDFEIESAKLSITNSIYGITDTVTGIVSWYSSQLMDATIDTPQQSADRINAVTKDDIIKAANKLQLDTVYVLKSN